MSFIVAPATAVIPDPIVFTNAITGESISIGSDPAGSNKAGILISNNNGGALITNAIFCDSSTMTNSLSATAAQISAVGTAQITANNIGFEDVGNTVFLNMAGYDQALNQIPVIDNGGVAGILQVI